MPIDPQAVLGRVVEGPVREYDDRDTMLYALSVGFGQAPTDRSALPFVFEGAGLVAVPTMSCVLGTGSALRALDLDWKMVLHVGQSLTMSRPLRPSGAVTSRSKIVGINDKGPGRGALIRQETEIVDVADQAVVATLGLTILARGDGGFGGDSRSTEARAAPQRPPDYRHVATTRPEQALLYRLNGDRMPVHADPDLAARAGFDRPILHGLCSYGIACRGAIELFAGHDPSRIVHIETRFVAPVFPGETLLTDFWSEEGGLAFVTRTGERGGLVLDGGWCRLSPERLS